MSFGILPSTSDLNFNGVIGDQQLIECANSRKNLPNTANNSNNKINNKMNNSFEDLRYDRYRFYCC